MSRLWDYSLWLYWDTLHLIVGALFVQKRGTCTSINDNNNIEQLDDIIDYDEQELVEAINESNNGNYKCSIERCSKVVGRF